MSKDIIFRKIRGRIVPIKRKDLRGINAPEFKRGLIKIGAGSAIGFAGGSLASKELRKSFKSFNQFAKIRGLSKLATPGSRIHSSLLKKAAILKIMGIRKTNLARIGFGLAIAATSSIIGSGVNDLFRKESEVRDEVAAAAGSIVGGAAVFLAARKFKIRATGVQELFSGFSKQGRRLTKLKIASISKAKFDPSKTRRTKTGFQFKLKGF